VFSYLIKARLDSWFTKMDELWSDVVKRSTYREEKEVKKKRPGQDWKTDKKNSEEERS